MMLTARGRYAVMAMVDMAQQSICKNGECGPVSLAQISERQQITIPYLEQIFCLLKSAKLVKSVRGPGGGYLLSTTPAEISVADIILAVDEDIKMTRCDHDPRNGCMASTKVRCLTHDLWDGLSNHIYGYLRSVSLEDVCQRRVNTRPVFSGQEFVMPMAAAKTTGECHAG